jgi:Fe-S-cluster containining protein
MQKFECRNYGDCCRRIRSLGTEGAAVKSAPGFFLVPEPKDVGLHLFDWEVDKLKELADKRGFALSIEPLWVCVSYKEEPIVLSWHMRCDSCPFFSEEKFCTIYDERPLACRTFPVADSGYLRLMRGDKLFYPIISSACRCWQEKVAAPEKMKPAEALKLFLDIFGSSYSSALKADLYTNWMMSEIVRGMAKSGKIVPAVWTRQELAKKMGGGYLRLTGFLERERIMTREEITEKLKELDAAASQLEKEARRQQ